MSKSNKEKEPKSCLIIGIILAIISIVLMACAIFMFFYNKDGATTISIISTILSALLGIVSIIYTYSSGKKTIDTIRKIEEQNEVFLTEIKALLDEDNYDKENIDDVRKNL